MGKHTPYSSQLTAPSAHEFQTKHSLPLNESENCHFSTETTGYPYFYFRNNLKPVLRTNHKFEIHTFPEPQNCNHCSKYLKGLVYQGYKCQVCGISVHKECIISSGRCGTSSTSTLPPPLPVHHGHVRVESQLCDKLW